MEIVWTIKQHANTVHTTHYTAQLGRHTNSLSHTPSSEIFFRLRHLRIVSEGDAARSAASENADADADSCRWRVSSGDAEIMGDEAIEARTLPALTLCLERASSRAAIWSSMAY